MANSTDSGQKKVEKNLIFRADPVYKMRNDNIDKANALERNH